MLKIFRNIRYTMIHSSKVSKYMLYAIGEIILVVIGILIALQINNWNEDRKQSKRRNIIMEELKKDFLYNKQQLSDNHSKHRNTYQDLKKVLEFFPINDASPLDSIASYFKNGNIFSWYTYNPRSGTVNSLITTSSFEIIEDRELRSLLVGWAGLVDDYTEDEIIANEFLSQYLIPYTLKNFDYGFDFSSEDSDLNALKAVEFKNLLKERLSNLYYLIEGGNQNDYTILKQSIDRILQLIEENSNEYD
ncbi:MAG: DUF6090 family protein [Flavobacteriaceae bacterium]|nr:DUF6090 family protein [Flavobacteriaceae bacterium]